MKYLVMVARDVPRGISARPEDLRRPRKGAAPLRGRIGDVVTWKPMTSEKIIVGGLEVFHAGPRTVTKGSGRTRAEVALRKVFDSVR